MPTSSSKTEKRILDRLSNEFDSPKDSIAQVLELTSQDYRIPYLSRYRIDETRGVSEERMYQILGRLREVRLLEEHRTTILEQLQNQDRLSPDLSESILAARDFESLDELHRPFKTERKKNRAELAREQGLGPLALALKHRQLEEGKTPLESAQAYVNAEAGILDARSALDGAKEILKSEVRIIDTLHERMRQANLSATAKLSKQALSKELRDYVGFEKPINNVAWQDFLALRKAEREEQLEVEFGISEEMAHQVLAAHYAKDLTDSADPLRNFYDSMLREAWHERLKAQSEREVLKEFKTRADRSAIRAYCKRYEEMLLDQVVGRVKVCGILPAIRKATRVVILDEDGKLLSHASLHPLKLEHKDGARKKFLQMLEEEKVQILALGAGPGCREIEAFLMEACTDLEERPQILIVDEMGTMALSRRELSRHDMSLRKAAILARRVQDPLVEWARMEPDQLDLGPFQDEVHQGKFTEALGNLRESCVHDVGLDIDHCLPETLACIAGLDKMSAAKILQKRQSRQLRSIKDMVTQSVLSEQDYMQATAFICFKDSTEALEATRVDPARYDLVEEMAASLGLSKAQLLEQKDKIDQIRLDAFTRDAVSRDTLIRILKDLRGVHKSPRKRFEKIAFKKEIKTLKDLSMGMELTGRVLRIADFGAFIDVGINTGGLLHISQMADRYVGDPRRVVQEGRLAHVRVLEVDLQKNRLSLTMRSGEIRKVQKTLGDFASGKHKPGAMVVPRGQPQEQEQSQSLGRSARRSTERGGRGGGPGGGRGDSRARPGGRGGHSGGGRRGDRSEGFGRLEGSYTTESEDIQETAAEARGLKGELTSFAALAGMLGSGTSEKKEVEAPKIEQPEATKPEAEAAPREASENAAAQSETPAGDVATPDAPDAPDTPAPSTSTEEENEQKGEAFGDDFV